MPDEANRKRPEENAVLERIVTGGQAGVDRAALDVALRLGVPCGGWCPRGRLAEDGPISPVYPLSETDSSDYAVRTAWNVRDSDATLVLAVGPLTGGTAYTVACTRIEGRPCLVVDLSTLPGVAEVIEWLEEEKVRCLNIAGPRASTAPGIYGLAAAFIESLLLEGCADR